MQELEDAFAETFARFAVNDKLATHVIPLGDPSVTADEGALILEKSRRMMDLIG